MKPFAEPCILLLVSLLAACGGGSSSSDMSGPASPPTSGSGPEPPTHVAAHAGDGQVELSWSGVSGAASYNLYWSTQPGATQGSRTLIANVTSPFVHDGLVNGTTYYYHVASVNDDGENVGGAELPAMPASGIDVRIFGPDSGARIGGSVPVDVTVESTFVISSVDAAIAGLRTGLAQDEPGSWTGELDVSSLPRGIAVLIVSAADATGRTITQSRSVDHDELPALTWTEPLPLSVARPSVRIVAECSDDDSPGCPSMKLTASGNGITETLVDRTGNAVNGEESLADFDGREVTLEMTVTDSAGQTVREQRQLLVDSSDRLVEAESVSGEIWDADRERIVFVDEASGHSVLKIRDRLLGTDTAIFDDADATLDDAHVAPFGAVFAAHSDDAGQRVLEWRDGALMEQGDVLASGRSTLVAAGDFAVWLAPAATDTDLTLRDLRNGVSLVVQSGAFNTFSVASDGDVVFAQGTTGILPDIFRYEDGVIETLTSDAGAGEVSNRDPRTDGAVVIYQKKAADDPVTYTLALHDGIQELAIAGPSSIQPYPYLVSGGHVAYHGADALGLSQVWVRAADASLTQVTAFSTSSEIQALSSDGDLAIANKDRRYVSRPPYASVDDVSSNLSDGPVYWQDGTLQLAIGRTLFEVTP